MLSGKWKWKIDPAPKIKLLRAACQKKILRKAIKSGAKIIQADLKATAPVRSGALRQSFSIKMVTKRSKVTGIVGPRSKFTKSYRGKTVQPVRYAHFAELHHHFMRQTMQSKRQQYIEEVRRITAQEIAKVL